MPNPRPRLNAQGQVTSWQVTPPTYYVDGIAHRDPPLGAKTKEQLRIKWKQWWANHERGLSRTSALMTDVAEFAAWYSTEILASEVAQGKKSETTENRFNNFLKNHVLSKSHGCGHLRLGTKGRAEQQLNFENLKGWVRRMARDGVGIPTQRRAVWVIRTLGKAMEENPSRSGFNFDPTERLEYPKEDLHDPKRMTMNEYKTDMAVTMALLDAAHEVLPAHFAALWDVANGLGLRRAEIAGLKWSDFGDDGYLTVRRQVLQNSGKYTVTEVLKSQRQRKQLKVRRVQVMPEVAAALKAQRQAQATLQMANRKAWGKVGDSGREAGDWVFSGDGLFMLPTQLQYLLEKMRKAAGPVASRMTLHKGRHDMASYKVAAGVAPDQIADEMGHANAQLIFSVYSHSVAREVSDSAAKMQALMDAMRAQARSDARAV